MGSVNNKLLIWFPVYNNSCSSCIYHKIPSMWSVIKFLYCSTSIDDVDSHTPYFDMFAWRSYYMPQKLRNITKQSISVWWESHMAYWYAKHQSSFLWLEFSKRVLIISTSVLLGISLLSLREEASRTVVWTIMFMLWHVLINSDDLASAPSCNRL